MRSIVCILAALSLGCPGAILVKPREVSYLDLGGSVYLSKRYPVEGKTIDSCGVDIIGAKSGYHVNDGRVYWLVRARFTNTGSKEVQRFDVAIRLFDAYAEEVYGKRWGRIQSIGPGETTIDAFSDSAYRDQKAAVRGEVGLLRVAYTDGTMCPAPAEEPAAGS